jgi:hypothetical protein
MDSYRRPCTSVIALALSVLVAIQVVAAPVSTAARTVSSPKLERLGGRRFSFVLPNGWKVRSRDSDYSWSTREYSLELEARFHDPKRPLRAIVNMEIVVGPVAKREAHYDWMKRGRLEQEEEVGHNYNMGRTHCWVFRRYFPEVHTSTMCVFYAVPAEASRLHQALRAIDRSIRIAK